MTEATYPARRSAPTVPAAVTLAVIGTIAMIAFGLGVGLGARGWDVAVLALALLTGFTALIPVIIDQARPLERRQLLITILMMVYGLFLVLPVFTNYFLVDEVIPGVLRLSNMQPRDIVNGQVATLLGLTSLMIAFYSPFGGIIAQILPTPTRDWPPPVALAVGALMVPLGWSIYLGGQFGLIPRGVGTGALGALASSIFFSISLITLVHLRTRWRVAVLMLLVVVPPLMIFNFFTGSKRLFLSPLFMIVLAYLVVERRIRVSWVIAGISALVVLYPVSQFYRDVVSQGRTLNAIQILSDPGRALSQVSGFFSRADPGEYLRSGLSASGSRLDGLGIATAIVKKTPDEVPFQNGRTLALIPISYIPRFLWPGKPGTTIGEWVTANYGSGAASGTATNKTDTGPTWIGELFFNFGYTGVIVGMAFMGIFFRVCQDLLFRPDAPIPALLAACVVLYAGARSVQGGLIGPINGIGYIIWPIIGAHFALRLFGLTTPGTAAAEGRS